MSRARAIAVACALAALAPALAQAPGFDAVTIRPADTRLAGGAIALPRLTVDPTHLTATNSTLRSLILQAWSLQDWQLDGGPAWINSDPYSVQAVTATPTDRDAMMGMLRTELEAAFQLQLTDERKHGAIYRLVSTDGGQRLGHPPPAEPGLPDLQMPVLPDGSRATILQYAVNRHVYGDNGNTVGRLTVIRCSGCTTADLATTLAGLMRGPVTDGSGLTGKCDFSLHFTADAEHPEASEPGLATALGEQLGLKLERETGDCTIKHVARAERPTIQP